LLFDYTLGEKKNQYLMSTLSSATPPVENLGSVITSRRRPRDVFI